MAQASKTISKPRLYAALAAAGFCGAVLRFCVQSLPFGVVAGFPLGTLLANTLGSFLIFLVFNYGVVRGGLSATAVKVINTGFMGAFTTMSAVGTDAIALVVGIRQFVVEILRRLHLVVDIDGLRLEEAADEIAEEQQRNIDDGRKHILRLPEVNLVCNLHTLLFRLWVWLFLYCLSWTVHDDG